MQHGTHIIKKTLDVMLHRRWNHINFHRVQFEIFKIYNFIRGQLTTRYTSNYYKISRINQY